jgi:hypothetical protein
MADEALSADELRALRVVDLKEKLIQIGLSVAGWSGSGYVYFGPRFSNLGLSLFKSECL